MNKCGGFSKNGTEFRISTYFTPRPWFNLLNNGRYRLWLSNRGAYGALLPKGGYVTLEEDRFLFFKDRKTGACYSPFQPDTKNAPKTFRCTHGFGYTRFEWAWKSFSARATYFVPREGTRDFCLVEIENTSGNALTLDLFYYVVPFLRTYDALGEAARYEHVFMTKYFYWCFREKNWLRCEARVPENRFSPYGHLAVGCSRPLSWFETSHRDFWGTEKRREAELPAGIERPCRKNVLLAGTYPVLAPGTMIRLPSGQTRSTAFETVFADDPADLRRRPPVRLEAAEQELKATVRAVVADVTGRVVVHVPEPDLNTQCNLWSKYLVRQTRCVTDKGEECFNYITFAYESVSHPFDRNHCHAILHASMNGSPPARPIIESSSGHLYANGIDCPPFDSWRKVPSARRCDQPLWYAWGILEYIKNTGDSSILDFKAGFVDDKRKTPLRDHLERILKHYEKDRGRHGLCHIHQRDWNDALNCGWMGKGESVWCTLFYAFILRETVRYCGALPPFTDAGHWRNVYGELKDIVNRKFWNGSWYARAVTDSGRIIGLDRKKDNRIFLLPQEWSILSGVCAGERQKAVIRSVRERLARPWGWALFDPPFSAYDPEIQSLSAFPPGVKENGSVWPKTVSWMTMALALAGEGDLAFKYFRPHWPSEMAKSNNLYKLEPYIFYEYVTGSPSTFAGEAEMGWHTGSAIYAQKAMVEYVLGVRPDYTGLFVYPCIPKHWKECSCRRTFRGADFHITIANPEGVESGVGRIEVNGRPQESPYLPARGKVVKATVFLSKRPVFRAPPDV